MVSEEHAAPLCGVIVDLEDRGRKFFRNVGKQVSDYTVL
jgi:hypothetical protein